MGECKIFGMRVLRTGFVVTVYRMLGGVCKTGCMIISSDSTLSGRGSLDRVV